MAKVKCIWLSGFNDLEAKKFRMYDEEFNVSEERAEHLKDLGFIEIIEKEKPIKVEIKEEPVKKRKGKIDTKF